MKETEVKSSSPFFRFTKRLVLFFTLCIIVSLLFYFTGSVNQFLDVSLLRILKVVQFFSAMLIVLNAVFFLEIIFFTFVEKNMRFLCLLFLMLLALIFSVLGLLLPTVVEIISRGIA